MSKKLQKRFTVIVVCAIAVVSVFFTQKVYADIVGDPCEYSKHICTPSSGEVCYLWMEEQGLPCVVSEYMYIDKNDNENEQGDVNR